MIRHGGAKTSSPLICQLVGKFIAFDTSVGLDVYEVDHPRDPDFGEDVPDVINQYLICFWLRRASDGPVRILGICSRGSAECGLKLSTQCRSAQCAGFSKDRGDPRSRCSLSENYAKEGPPLSMTATDVHVVTSCSKLYKLHQPKKKIEGSADCRLPGGPLKEVANPAYSRATNLLVLLGCRECGVEGYCPQPCLQEPNETVAALGSLLRQSISQIVVRSNHLNSPLDR